MPNDEIISIINKCKTILAKGLFTETFYILFTVFFRGDITKQTKICQHIQFINQAKDKEG